MDWAARTAARNARLEVSRAVTEILRLTERPEVISFAGGLPDPSAFLLEEFEDSARRVLRERGGEALNYGPTAGYRPLRRWITERMAGREGIQLGEENVLVTSGGLEALNLVAMALLEPGSTVLVGAPSYLAALHVFSSHQCRMLPVPVDDEGLEPDALEEALERCGADDRPRLLYVIPSFQNPSGATLSLGRRRRIVEICGRYGVPIVEDHAYADLRYEGDPLPPLAALSPDGVIFVHTFSKICAPGLRLGWVAAARELIETLVLCKIGTDQCANTLGQRIVLDFARRGAIERQLERAVPLYRRKRDRLEAELSRRLPGVIRWSHPEGGFYLWLRLPEGADSESLLERAIAEHEVAFVAGPPFYAGPGGREFLRLSYSFIAEDRIEEGVVRLSRSLSSCRGPAA